MLMRWLSCGGGSIHIVGACPNCYSTKGGLLLGTVASTHKGRVSAKCLDCDNEVDYYVDAHDEKIWKMDPVEAKGSRIDGAPH